MSVYVDGLGTIRTWDTGSSDIVLDPGYSNNFRYISFNYHTSFDYGLVMSGITPLTVRHPKRQEINIPYSHGSLDVSTQDGNLYFDDREVTYNFGAIVQRLFTGEKFETNNEINKRCQHLMSNITNWLMPAQSNTTEEQPFSGIGDLYDNCAGTYSNSRCVKLEISKDFYDEYWVLAISATFKLGQLTSINSDVGEADMLIPSEELREIIFNGSTSFTKRLFMSGSTPLSAVTSKRASITSNIMDGEIDRSYFPTIVNGQRKSIIFYEDRKIDYTFYRIWHRTENNTHDINLWMQNSIEEIANWLYMTNNLTNVVEWNGMKMKGVGILKDSFNYTFGEEEEGYSLMFARCTGLNVSKVLGADYWILVIQPQFTVYPFAKDNETGGPVLL